MTLCNPVKQMLYEHQLGRQFVAKMEEGLKTGDDKKVISNAMDYASLLQQHILKEDNILFKIADQSLREDVQKSMMEKYEETYDREYEMKYLKIARDLEEHARRN